MKSFLNEYWPEHKLTRRKGSFIYGTNIHTGKNEQCGYFDGNVIYDKSMREIGYYNHTGGFAEGGEFIKDSVVIGYSDGSEWSNIGDMKNPVAYYGGDDDDGLITDYRKPSDFIHANKDTNISDEKSEKSVNNSFTTVRDSKTNRLYGMRSDDFAIGQLEQLKRNIENHGLFAKKNEGKYYKVIDWTGKEI